MEASRWLPGSLGRRFALAAAGLAVAALLVTSLASWWLINREHGLAARELSARETQYRAASVGSDLKALAERMAEIASSTILATALVDSAGRETYLEPFLGGIRQINGIPVQVLLTDFEGVQIADNGGAAFAADHLDWLRRQLEIGQPAAKIVTSENGAVELLAFEPMLYARTASPEGAILYKVALHDVDIGPSVRLTWGPRADDAGAARAAEVPVPAIFGPLQLRVRTEALFDATGGVPLPYLPILTLMLTLFALVVFAGLRLARLLTLDLQHLEAFSSRVVGSGLGSVRAPESGSLEVASLAHSINAMLDRLTHQHATLLREREKLTELAKELQLADRRKDDFLAMLGHELRNPLAPISTGAHLLRMIPNADPRVTRTSEIIVRQVGQMTKIVNDLLDVSRVTRGLITLEHGEVDIADVVRAAVEQVQPLIDASHHTLTIDMPPEPVCVQGDHARLVQVVANLVANATKYTADGGLIHVGVTATPQQVTVAVRDNGAGMPAALIPDVFDLFTQGSRAADRSQGGLGLGLALVKHLVGLHHGQVEAASDGVGQGATFTVRLPRVGAAPAANADAPGPVAETDPDHRSGAESPQRSLHVLVVDDNLDAAQTLAHWLALEGHTVSIAADGPGALALARDATPPFAVCILDIGLPGMNGMELARRLRAMAEARDAMLVALTGYGQASDREKSAAAGFDHHLVKPTDPAQLHALLADRAA